MHLPSFAKHEKPYASTTVKNRVSFPKSDQREAHDFLSFCKNTESGAYTRTD